MTIARPPTGSSSARTATPAAVPRDCPRCARSAACRGWSAIPTGCRPWWTAPSSAGDTGCGGSDRSCRSLPDEEPITLGEGDTPLLRLRAHRRAARPRRPLGQGRGRQSDGLVQGARARAPRSPAPSPPGPSASCCPRPATPGSPPRRTRARAGVPVRVYAPRTHPAHHPLADRRLRRRPGAARRAHRRLRPRRPRSTPRRPVRSISRRLREPYRIEGKKTLGWSSRCSSAGPCPTRSSTHRRRHRPDRHVEGVSRASRCRLGPGPAAPHVHGAEHRLRPRGAGVRRAAPRRASHGRSPGPSRAGSGCPGRSAGG